MDSMDDTVYICQECNSKKFVTSEDKTGIICCDCRIVYIKESEWVKVKKYKIISITVEKYKEKHNADMDLDMEMALYISWYKTMSGVRREIGDCRVK